MRDAVLTVLFAGVGLGLLVHEMCVGVRELLEGRDR
jgi:hypothetical protein